MPCLEAGLRFELPRVNCTNNDLSFRSTVYLIQHHIIYLFPQRIRKCLTRHSCRFSKNKKKKQKKKQIIENSTTTLEFGSSIEKMSQKIHKNYNNTNPLKKHINKWKK